MTVLSFKPSSMRAAVSYAWLAVALCVLASLNSFNRPSLIASSVMMAHAIIHKQTLYKVLCVKIDRQAQTVNITVRKTFKTEVGCYPLSELRATYKKEVGARGVKRFSLKIYQHKNLLVEIVPDTSGWARSVLKEVAMQIEKEQERT